MEFTPSAVEEEQPLDALGRRKPHIGRQSTGVRVNRNDADIDGLLIPCQRHGLQTSNFLCAFNKQRGGRVNTIKTKLRLRDLYHEDNSEYGGPVLDRRIEKHDWRAAPYFLDQHNGRLAIPEEKRHLYASRADLGWFDHQVMTGAITGSIDLAAYEKYGVDVYGDQEAIFTHKLCPDATSALERPIDLYLYDRTEYDKKTGRAKKVRTTVTPDQLFKISYPGEDPAGPPRRIRFFALEADRDSETLDTIREKVRRWLYALKHDRPKAQWGTPSLIILIVVPSEHRMRKIMEVLRAMAAEEDMDTDAFLFKHEPRFASSRSLPVMPHFFTTPWHRADGSTFDISY